MQSNIGFTQVSASHPSSSFSSLALSCSSSRTGKGGRRQLVDDRGCHWSSFTRVTALTLLLLLLLIHACTALIHQRLQESILIFRPASARNSSSKIHPTGTVAIAVLCRWCSMLDAPQGSKGHFLLHFLNDVALIKVSFLNYVSGFSIVAVCICSHQVKKTAIRDGFETSRIPSIWQELNLIKCIFLGRSNIDMISDLTVSFVHSLDTVLPLD